jgi:hypothetical protein
LLRAHHKVALWAEDSVDGDMLLVLTSRELVLFSQPVLPILALALAILFHQRYRDRPYTVLYRLLITTRPLAFASLRHQRTQPIGTCCEERERVRLALSLPWPALGTRYRVAEKHPAGQRLSVEE